MVTFLAADIGGTKSELAILPSVVSDGRVLWQKRYINAEFTGMEEIIRLFLAELDHVPRIACIAVAGVVAGDMATMTNLPWKIDCSLLAKRFGFEKVMLINDMTAVCSSLTMLGPNDILQIQPGRGQKNNICGVVAPGTGLGEGLVVECSGQLVACGSEGGHTDFAPVDEEQLALLGWMQKKKTPVSYEMLIAGPGLADLYDFCKVYHQIEDSFWLVEEMTRAKDRIPVIVAGAIAKKPCPLCGRVIELFLSILGSEAGNLALKLYAKGGIYLGGGILPRLVGHVSFDGFLRHFHAKEQMTAFMQEIPVYLILKKDAALIGTARFAQKELENLGLDSR